MNITLPDELRPMIERQAKASGCDSVEQYVMNLVLDFEVSDVPEPPQEARYSADSREELEAKLLEGMNTTGDIVVGPDFWKQRLLALQAREGKE